MNAKRYRADGDQDPSVTYGYDSDTLRRGQVARARGWQREKKKLLPTRGERTFSVSRPYIMSLSLLSVRGTRFWYDKSMVRELRGGTASSPAECSWYRSEVHTEATSRQSLAYIPALSPWLLAHSPENPTRPPTLKWTDCATTPCKGDRSFAGSFGVKPFSHGLPTSRLITTGSPDPPHA